jgi:Integrase core domain
MDALKELSKELGYPSGDKLWRAVQRRGIQVQKPDVLAYAKAQGQRQIFAARPKYNGKIVATDINDRWAADLIDYTTKPSRGKDDQPSVTPYQYILFVQDVFSRKIWAVSLRFKTPDVVQQAFEHIVRSGGGVPRELDTDDGAEFKGPFDAYLEEEHVEHSIADPRNKNARGMLDAAIRAFKQQLARIQVAENTRDWASLVSRAAKAYDESEHSALIGGAPNDVAEDDDLQFLLTERAAKDLQTNQTNIENRGAKLQRLGGFRAELPHKGRGFERNFKPRYADQVHQVSAVIGGDVVTTSGRSFPTRHVLAVPAATEAVNTGAISGGNEQIDKLRLASLQPYKASIVAFIGVGPKWIHEVSQHMKEIGAQPLMKNGLNYKKALTLLGFSVDDRGQVTIPAAQVAHAHVPILPAAGPVVAPRMRIHIKRAPRDDERPSMMP